MKTIELSREPVELFKILKFEGIADSGGQAKAMIDDGEVIVNGEVETRKRKKIVSGDTLECLGEVFEIRLASDKETQ